MNDHSLNYKAYLIDLDGTVYHGSQPIPEAVQFVRYLRERDVPYLFLTNNSTRQPEEVASQLQQMGVPATADNVLTSAQVAAHYVANRFASPHVFVIGEDGLKHTLLQAGCHLIENWPNAAKDDCTDADTRYDCHAVIVGLDRQFSYDKLTLAVRAIRNGALFIGTNGDRLLPTDDGWLPGNGSLCAAVREATQVEPIYMGKPERAITDMALQLLGLPREQVIMVGDNLETDILAGVNAEIDTLFVLSGVSAADDIETLGIRPTHMVKNLQEWQARVSNC